MSQVRPGIFVAVIVFTVFAAYAYLAPATYRTSGFFAVNAGSGGGTVTLPEPLEAARRLSEAVLDRKTLGALSRDRAASSDPEAQALASSAVRRGLEIETSDGHSFVLSYRDSDAARAQRACNALIDHAVELAPLVLLDHRAERALDLKRQEQTQELTAFLALHPQVAAEPPPTGLTSPDKDPIFSAFQGEKANLEHRILAIESGTLSDNPYVDPRDSDLKLLRRRLVEIDSVLTARRAAFEAKPSGATLSPDLRAEWKRLLDVLSQSAADADHAKAPTLVAKRAALAPLPTAPIEPNRRLLLFFGVVFGVGLGAAFTLTARATQQRRMTKSSRPQAEPPQAKSPTVPIASAEQTVHVPTAPGIPTGLGPSVPAFQPHSNRAPPIVPIPQRPISSSPPDAAAAAPAAPSPPLVGIAPVQVGNAAQPSSMPPRPAGESEEPRRGPSSRPPARRFASTLVLPPAQNPAFDNRGQVPDPALASTNQAWEQQIRAHDVPGFAVVKPPSEPPPAAVAASATVVAKRADEPAPATVVQRPASRAPNQMKVTQPLGSFLSELEWNDQTRDRVAHEGAAQLPSIPPPRSPSPAPPAQYSYVSTPPPAPRASVIRVEEVAQGWHPDPSLTPAAQRSLCERLYPFAVEKCFVVAVVGVPEAVSYKSRVAAELALALAESLHPRILLLEGDLHRPWVQRMIGVNRPISSGFSQQLNARTGAAGESQWTVSGCTKSLHVLAEGMMRSPGLLLSKQFADCVKELRTYYDFIIIDGPTMSLDLDAGALDAVTDGLITVCPANGSPALAQMHARFGEKRFSAFATSP